MKVVNARDVRTGVEDDDKYWAFVGEDWVWMKLSKYDASMCRDAKGSTGRRLDPYQVAAARASSHAGSSLVGVSAKTAFRWKIRVKECEASPTRLYALVLTHLFPTYVAVIGWAHGFTVMRGGPVESFEEATDRYFELSWHAVSPMSELNQRIK